MTLSSHLFILFAGLLWLSPSLHADKVSGMATGCGHHDYPPWNWEEGGRIVGACAEAATMVLGQAGVVLDLTYVGPWKRCQREIQQGKVDVNICSFINPEREQYSVFVETPVGYNEIAIFQAADRRFPFQSWQDLNHQIVGIVRGVSMGEAFDRFLEAQTRLVKTNHYQSLFRMLRAHRLDAVPFGRQSGRTYLRAMGMDALIVDLPTPVQTGKLYLSMSKQSPHLSVLPRINEALMKPGYPEYMQNLLDKYARRYAETHRVPAAR